MTDQLCHGPRAAPDEVQRRLAYLAACVAIVAGMTALVTGVGKWEGRALTP